MGAYTTFSQSSSSSSMHDIYKALNSSGSSSSYVGLHSDVLCCCCCYSTKLPVCQQHGWVVFDCVFLCGGDTCRHIYTWLHWLFISNRLYSTYTYSVLWCDVLPNPLRAKQHNNGPRDWRRGFYVTRTISFPVTPKTSAGSGFCVIEWVFCCSAAVRAMPILKRLVFHQHHHRRRLRLVTTTFCILYIYNTYFASAGWVWDMRYDVVN